MRVSVILGHPEGESLNHAIADVVVKTLKDNGHEVIFHDLYKENFNPVLPASEVMREASVDPEVEEYASELSSSDGIVVIHPIWWGEPPAIIKGWVDRVFRPGCAYVFETQAGSIGQPVGLLKSASVLIFNTQNTTEEAEREYVGDPMDTIWKKIIFGLCGTQDVKRHVFHGVMMASDDERRAWLNDVREIVDESFPKSMEMAA